MATPTCSLHAAMAVAGAGIAFYACEHRGRPASAVCPPVAAPSTPSARNHDDDMLRRRLEGIGSTTHLKRVPLPLRDQQ